MPYLAIERARQTCGWSAHEPIVLVEPAGRGERVVQCNPAAARAGVRPGMPRAEAQAAVRSLRTIVCDAQQARQTLERLAAWADCLSPIVQLDEPDSLLLDVTGCAPVFGGEPNLLRQALAGIHRQGFTVRGAIADTAGAAWAIAHADPRASVIVPPGQTPAALACLPVWALRLPPEDLERLEALGIETIEALLHLPRASLAARLSPRTLHRLDQALGQAPEPLAAFRPRPGVCCRLALPAATDRLDVLEAALDRLAAELCAKLRRRRAGIGELRCALHHKDGSASRWELHLARLTRSAKHIRSLLWTRLAYGRVRRPVCGLMLWSRRIHPLDDAQLDLFARERQQEAQDVAQLVDRLASRLGRQAVVRPEPVPDHQPEYAYTYVPSAGGPKPQQPPEAQDIPARPRPVRLLPRPLQVPAMALRPEGPPGWFRWQGQSYEVLMAVGPERLETGWWRGRDIQRDYFRVLVRSGGQYWLFRDRSSGRWFLHGVFD